MLFEREGQPPERMLLYGLSIAIILVGLVILLQGERAGLDGGLINAGDQPANGASEMQNVMGGDELDHEEAAARKAAMRESVAEAQACSPRSQLSE